MIPLVYLVRMETRLLHYFKTVVDEGSISRAAAALHMTQPPLSAALSQLEKDLGVQLLTRTPRGVIPTPAGQELATYAQETLGGMERMKRHLQNINHGGVGTLRLACVFPYLWGHLPKILDTLTTPTSTIDITLRAPAPLEVVTAVRRKIVDLGVLAVTSTEELQAKYGHEFEVFPGQHTALAVAIPAWLADLPDPLDLQLLNDEAWLMPESTLGVRSLPELIRQAWTQSDLTPTKEHYVESLATAVPLVIAGVGVTLMPDTFRDALSKDLSFKTIAQPIAHLEFAIIKDRSTPVTSAMQRFLDLAVTQ